MNKDISAPIHSLEEFSKLIPIGHSQHISGPKFKELTEITSV